jgi:hypothetical protein
MTVNRALALTLLIYSYNLTGQDEMQLLRGTLRDASSQRPITAASVLITGKNTYTGTTDTSGTYAVKVEPGTYSIFAMHNAYRGLKRDHVIVTSAKQRIEDFELSSFNISLDTIAVTAEQEGRHTNISSTDIQRYAAAFYDPARAVTSRASVVNIDDQANNISVRGTPPTYIQWRLEGAEILNPSHLENAGTVNDRPALFGGGVSMLSPQLLQSSVFNIAPFDAGISNALSAVFDLKLRNGNNERTEGTVQASLLGTDLSVEGPFRKGRSASYLVNFRYSTVGMLSAMGINFGREKINFYDVSYVGAVPLRNGMIRIFGFGGSSVNKFSGERDSTLLKEQKDLFDINYNSRTLVNGISFLHSIDNTSYLKAVLSYSDKRSHRESLPTGVGRFRLRNEADDLDQEKISGNIFFSKRIVNSFKIKTGVQLVDDAYKAESSSNDSVKTGKNIATTFLFPYLNAEGTLGKIQYLCGLQVMMHPASSQIKLLPRAEVKLQAGESQFISLAYGKQAQIQPPYIQSAGTDDFSPGPTLSHAWSLLYDHVFRLAEFKAELFYQTFDAIPYGDAGFSGYNYFNGPLALNVTSTGKARSYGTELSLQRHIRDFYFIISSTLYNSEFFYQDDWRQSRFNSRYNAVLTVGDEFQLGTAKKYFGVGGRFYIREGFREPYPLPDAYDHSVTSQLPPYSRIDIRISYKRDAQKYSSVVAIDIQNVLNQQNVAYHYFDVVAGGLVKKYQLGIIPVLSYRIFF